MGKVLLLEAVFLEATISPRRKLGEFRIPGRGRHGEMFPERERAVWNHGLCLCSFPELNVIVEPLYLRASVAATKR